MSVALQIRDVPEAVRDALAARAAADGQSLQAYLLSLVSREAALLGNWELLSRPLPDGGLSEPVDSVALVRRMREERDAHLLRTLE